LVGETDCRKIFQAVGARGKNNIVKIPLSPKAHRTVLRDVLNTGKMLTSSPYSVEFSRLQVLYNGFAACAERKKTETRIYNSEMSQKSKLSIRSNPERAKVS
jgi:hypothetical protein